MNKRDCRDTFVLGAVTFTLAAATTYVFMHPSEGAFATLGGIYVTLIGAYHWLCVTDDKKEDA